MKNSIAITISDGWAYRYLFSTGAYDFLSKEYDITLICSNYYKNLLDKKLIKSIPIKSIKFIDSSLISILNFFYRSSFDNAINNFYLSKYSFFPKALYYFFVKWHIAVTFIFFKKAITLFLEFRCKYFYSYGQLDSVDSVLFLSPYAHNEIILSFILPENTRKIFILPSWDNVYKYHLFDNYNKYIVWGENQKNHLRKYTSKPIICLGSLGQFAINKILLIHNQKRKNKFVINYSTVTTRIFHNEINFVNKLAEMIEADCFGKRVQLIIRLHPADKNTIYYNTLASNRVKISTVSGRPLDEWNVDKDFYSRLVDDIKNSDLVINVASTITLDSILMNRFVINIRPNESHSARDYYQFQHYLPITQSNLVPIFHEKDIQGLSIYIEALRRNCEVVFNQSKAIELLTVVHKNYELATYFNLVFN